MTDCIFCKIIEKEIPTHIVYEDEATLAFLDRNPIRPGHLLVIPKRHEPDIKDLDKETYHTLMDVVQKLSRKVSDVLKPQRVGLVVSGWDVPHTHVHVVPMEQPHDISSRLDREETVPPSTDELSAIAQRLI